MENPIFLFVSRVSEADFAKYIDHTILKPDAPIDAVRRVIDEARACGFATAVVPPSSLELVKDYAKGVRLGTVVGFPNGYMPTRAKVAEVRYAIEEGAEEIDVVMNIHWFKSRLYDKVLEDLRAVVKEAKSYGNIIVKVIIETCYLTDEEKVKATEIVADAGADFVKTSTGFGPRGATVHDVALLAKAGRGRVKVKASGGIRHAEDAIAMILAGAERIGTSSGVKIFEEYKKLREALKSL